MMSEIEVSAEYVETLERHRALSPRLCGSLTVLLSLMWIAVRHADSGNYRPGSGRLSNGVVYCLPDG